EDLAVRAGDLFPAADVGDVHRDADDIAERRTRLRQRVLDFAEDVLRLRVGVADAVNSAGFVAGRRARNKHTVANPHGPRVTGNGFPWRTRGNVDAWHSVMLSCCAAGVSKAWSGLRVAPLAGEGNAWNRGATLCSLPTSP